MMPTKSHYDHSIVLDDVTDKMILNWAKSKQPNLPDIFKGPLSLVELAYIVRRLALGDHVHIILTSIDRPFSPHLRNILYKIQNLLVEKKILIRPSSRKLPNINAQKLQEILDGVRTPNASIVGVGKERTVTRDNLYYMIYLRHVANLSRLQMIRVTNCPTADIILSRYNLWKNPKAHARNYATGNRKQHKTPTKIKWIHPDKLVASEILDYKTYKLQIRHFTNKMVDKYGHLIRNAKYLNKGGHVVDHMLSVKDGFNCQGKQTPWQMLCHPANLQVLTYFDNASKGAESDLNPEELENRISQFNRKHGVVLMPIDAKILKSLHLKFRAINANRKARN